MRITCPKCGHTAEVDDLVIPEGTTSVRCHACRERFPLARESERSVENGTGFPFRCPVCRTGQERDDACRECGLAHNNSVTHNNSVSSTPMTKARVGY